MTEYERERDGQLDCETREWEGGKRGDRQSAKMSCM
jgi:hypothetical protein